MREQEIDAKAKAKAEIYRELADLIDLADALPSDSDMTPADYIRKQANRLDPPKPKIPNGTLCVADHPQREYAQVCGYMGEWGLYHASDLDYLLWNKKDITNIRPAAPALAPGQVAVDRQAIAEARDLLRFEQHNFTAGRLQAALDRDTEARR